MKSNTKSRAIKMAQKVLANKQEVVKWIRSGEPFENLEKKGITLGRIGK